jgi:nucleolar MIF4G domain-containing protein 1
LAHEPLRVSLEDLHSAESKGKWWLVGAAWGGDPLVDRRQEANTDDGKNVNDNALLTLAKKQGMNTDVRRSIFVVLMSSDVRIAHPLITFASGLTGCVRTMSMPVTVCCS